MKSYVIRLYNWHWRLWRSGQNLNQEGHFSGTGCAIYSDVIMSMMASRITCLTIVYSTGYSPHKGPVRRKCFYMMTLSWPVNVSSAKVFAYIRSFMYGFISLFEMPINSSLFGNNIIFKQSKRNVEQNENRSKQGQGEVVIYGDFHSGTGKLLYFIHVGYAGDTAPYSTLTTCYVSNTVRKYWLQN